MFIVISLFICLFLSFCSFLRLGFKPYMYISPMTERMRKRKAFADTELEDNGRPHFLASSMTSSSHVGNLTPPYSRLSMLTLPQNGHLTNILDYHALQQTTVASEHNNSVEYLSAPTSMNDYPLSELLMHSKSPSSSLSLSPPLPSPHLPSCSPSTSQQRIRIIDDAKLMYMRRQTNEPSSIYNERLMANQHNSESTVNAKPKLSFSIESIIGIK